jgi:hypothetical protein
MALTIQTAKGRTLAILSDLSRCQIGVHVSLDVHADHGPYPSEAVDHHPDQGTVAQRAATTHHPVVSQPL